MSTSVNNAGIAGKAKAAATKKQGMGIKKDTRGASSLKFNPDPAINDGLCLGALKAVAVGKAEFKEDQKGDYAEFAGKTLPTIQFVFEGLPARDGAGAPVHVHSYKPVAIIPGDSKYDWIYDGMFQTIKHFIDVLSDNNFRDEYEDLLELAIDTENGMTFEELEAAYTKFFNGVAAVFNGTDTLPCLIKNANGDAVLLWIKLLLYTANSKGTVSIVNNGAPGFSNYPGDGLIELFVPNVAPQLRINIAKGESIIPKERTENKPTAPASTTTGIPTSAGAPQGSAAAGANIPGFMKKG